LNRSSDIPRPVPLTAIGEIRRVKILFVSAEPIRSKQASATHIGEIVRGLRMAGHEVITCATRVMGPYDRTSAVSRGVGYIVYWSQVLWRLWRSELIYARAHPANFPVALAAWLTGTPIIHEINGPYHDVAITHRWVSPFMGLVAALYRFQYRKANALVTVTAGLADWLRREIPTASVFVVANAANSGAFNPAQPPLNPTGRGYALFFGSLTRWHGIEVLLAAIEDKAWPELDLVIIGDGQLQPMARDAANRNSKIHLVSSVPQELLARYITGATVGLVPLNSLGGRSGFGVSPLKLYEMLACALPVVVTEFPGQAELVRSLKAGLVVPPDDPPALAQAVSALSANPPTRDQMIRVASIIETEHSWTNRVGEIEKILTRASTRAGLVDRRHRVSPMA
jgi:glycosyltransferase involved in cell wall biosynthesis